MPQITVLMPVWNGEMFLAEAIDSILGQTFTDFELLIVDDGSRDKTPIIIQDYAKGDARIRVCRHPENRGLSSARNTGIAHATGELITGMDADDVSLPRRLEKQVAFLEAHPDIGAVGVSHHVCDENLMPKLSQVLPARHHSIVLHTLLYTRSAMKRATMLVRREYLDMRHLYDPTVAFSADVALFLRLLWEKRIRFANLEEQLYLYRRHDNSQARRHRAKRSEAIIQARRPALRQLGERGMGVEWIVNKSPPIELSWTERHRARRDITRLIAAMVEHNWVDAGDEPLLHAEMNQLLESTTPRYWQMFLHWYRYRIARYVR